MTKRLAGQKQPVARQRFKLRGKLLHGIVQDFDPVEPHGQLRINHRVDRDAAVIHRPVELFRRLRPPRGIVLKCVEPNASIDEHHRSVFAETRIALVRIMAAEQLHQFIGSPACPRMLDVRAWALHRAGFAACNLAAPSGAISDATRLPGFKPQIVANRLWVPSLGPCWSWSSSRTSLRVTDRVKSNAFDCGRQASRPPADGHLLKRCQVLWPRRTALAPRCLEAPLSFCGRVGREGRRERRRPRRVGFAVL